MKKTIQIEIPQYLTVEQFDRINSIEKEEKLDQIAITLSALTGYNEEEIKTWSVDSLQNVYDKFKDLGDNQNEFHSIIEWNGTLYGYSDIKSMTLGCYIDIENLSKDLKGNLHKIAAILYRPITNHRFDSLKFQVKQRIKMLNNKVENVFDWYEIEKYDSKKRKQREEEFKAFPAHILTGALSFFLSTGSLYLNSIPSSEILTKKLKREMNWLTMESLLLNTTGGGGLYTNSVSPIYSQLQGIVQS
jgi:hypothetical protein